MLILCVCGMCVFMYICEKNVKVFSQETKGLKLIFLKTCRGWSKGTGKTKWRLLNWTKTTAQTRTSVALKKKKRILNKLNFVLTSPLKFEGKCT